ncbi:hypothetical protein EYF80_006133 [Liparis tanakae]|uniref:Uncharacterized protein n=1 Tax=Liparis tanakae TaxID=230148 RepID=A0A4Z2IZW2_9TELE|nr:hypothetical protein EYF80_006133 [Liparis tanakae]
MDPIHRDAFWGLNAATDHHRVVGGVTGHVYLGAVGTYKRIFFRDRSDQKIILLGMSRSRATAFFSCGISRTYSLRSTVIFLTSCLLLTSSDRSWQSMPPSHLQLLWIHSPSAHWKSSGPQRCAASSGCRPTQFCGHSSDPSAQSASPSQLHRAGTHTELLHWKDSGLQLGMEQDASSEPSEQSSSPSHTKP